MPRTNEQRKLECVIGNVGGNGTYRETPTGKTVFSFSLARPTGFSQDAPPPQWYSVAVWDKSIAEQIEDRIYAGAKVAVIGPVRVNESDGKTYRNLDAYRIGFVDYVFPEKREGDTEKTPTRTAQSTRKAVDYEDDDLDF